LDKHDPTTRGMKLILLFVGFTVGTVIAALVAYFVMNMLRMILMTVFVARRQHEAEKRLSNPRDQILNSPPRFGGM
jgi:membrane protein insertase Oxa1/YidC/SpoIIIJ